MGLILLQQSVARFAKDFEIHIGVGLLAGLGSMGVTLVTCLGLLQTCTPESLAGQKSTKLSEQKKIL